MKNEITVSVGIPTYDRPDGLRETLKRICNQTYQNLEIIVSDNHSAAEHNIAEIVNNFAENDVRIRFFRQSENIGSILNFRFLLGKAKGDFFMWAADDDLLDHNYIENCVLALQENPLAVVSITGFDVEDRMQTPLIKREYTKYLMKLPNVNTYIRLRNYILLPEYCGKYRVLWGVVKRVPLIDAFDEVLSNLRSGERPMWSYMPIDLALLARGDLAVVPLCSFHAFLLSTSDGKKESVPSLQQQIRMNRRGFKAFRMVIDKSQHLTIWDKEKLKGYLFLEELYALTRMLPYHCIRQISPSVARMIKKFWFEILMRK